MPVYEYKALSANGKTIAGIIDADSAQTARQKLRSSQKYPVSLKEVTQTAGNTRGRWLSMFDGIVRVNPTELAMITRQLSTLVNAGFPIDRAIGSVVPHTRSKRLKRSLANIKDAITEGNSFAAALAQYPNLFSPLYVSMVKAGESSGTLDLILDRLAVINEKSIALSNRIRTAMAYPLLMAVIGSLILFFLVTFVVPSITSIFTDMNQQLPLPTVLLLSISGFMKVYWPLILLAAGGLMAGFQFFRMTIGGRIFLDRLYLRTPVFSDLIEKMAMARLSRTLASLLENGVSMLPALDISKSVAGNAIIADSLETVAAEVEKGQGLAPSMERFSHFPSLAVQMVQVGEQSGALEEMLKKVADAFDNETEARIMSATTMLEPLMILLMGVAVGFIVLAICLPIFEMNQLVK
ncbi:MAG: type II secretion system F family protein [Pseudomonadota bacterium]